MSARRSMRQAWRCIAPDVWQGKNRTGELGNPARAPASPVPSNLGEIHRHTETRLLLAENLIGLSLFDLESQSITLFAPQNMDFLWPNLPICKGNKTSSFKIKICPILDVQ